MSMANIGTIEATMFVEYIRNYIEGQLSDFFETNAKDIERTCSRMNLSVLFKSQMNQTVDLHIVQPYIAFIDKLVRDINGKLYEFFGLRREDPFLQPKFPGLFHYQLDEELLAEYVRTETLSGVMEKLINKTLDFACLNRVPNPLVKQFFDPLSVGGLIMCASGLDRGSSKDRHRQELCRKLKGIGKNVNKRAAKLMITQYTAFMHQKIEEAQTPSSYEQAV